MFSHLRYAHATLWIDDRAYRWSWYIWPQLAALLIAGFMFFTFNSPADNHATWAKPSNAEDVARSLQLLRDQAYENRSAFERLEKLSAGNAVASFYLATLYDPNMPRRSSSIAADAKRTLKLYEPAAEQGNQFAQFNLIMLLMPEKFGVQDFEAGCSWRRKLGKAEHIPEARIADLKKVDAFCDNRAHSNEPSSRPAAVAPSPGQYVTLSTEGWSVIPPPVRQTPGLDVGSRLRERSQQFIAELYQMTSGSADNLSAALDKLYAPTVTYYGKEMSRDQVTTQVRNYLERWPIRRYAPKEGSINTNCDESALTCTVTGVVQFDAQSPIRNQRSMGEATFEYQLRFQTTQQPPQITVEGGAVINRTVRALSPETNDSPLKNFLDLLRR